MQWLRSNKATIFLCSFYVAVVVSFLVLLSSLWLHRVFFTPERLSEITTTALNEQSSLDSISSAVTDKLFEGRPLLHSTVGPRLQPVISGLLTTDFANNAVERTVERLRLAMTTESTAVVSIQLTAVKDTIVNLQNALRRDADEQRINAANIPDEIVLIDGNKIPNYYDVGVALLWLGPLSAIIAIGGLIFWVYRGRKAALRQRMIISGVLVVVSSAIALLAGPLFEPLFVSISGTASGQTLLGNLYDGLIEPFNMQAIVLGITGLLLVLVAVAMPYLQRWQPKKPTQTKKK